MSPEIATDSEFGLAGTENLTAASAPQAQPAVGMDVAVQQVNQIGPLAGLVGIWKGHGFNAIWRPHHPASQDRFLMLNRTEETIVFTESNCPVPNRGLANPDIDMFGLTYLQQIADATTQQSDGRGQVHVLRGTAGSRRGLCVHTRLMGTRPARGEANGSGRPINERARRSCARVGCVLACCVGLAGCGGSSSATDTAVEPGPAATSLPTTTPLSTTIVTSAPVTTTPVPAAAGTAFANFQLSLIADAVNGLTRACPAPDPNNTDTLAPDPSGCFAGVNAVTTAIDAAKNCVSPTTPLSSELDRLQGDVGGISSGPIAPNVFGDLSALQTDDATALNNGGQPLSGPGC